MSRISEKGRAGETAVRQYLEQKGCHILAQNYRIRGGEIDLIAVSGDEILFVEVKTRSSANLYSGYEAVDKRKKTFLMRAAMHYCSEHIIDLQPRFDVAVVCMDEGMMPEIDYLENAFDFSDCDEFI